MFKTILVPLDGSSRAEAALPVAARIARNTDATLVLVRVVSFASEYGPAMTFTHPSLAQAVVDTDLEEAAAYLKKVAATTELAGITVKTTARFGPPAPTILAEASSSGIDLVVICSHGYSGMIHWMMGSVAEKIARYAPMPVLVVRETGVHLGGTAHLAEPLRILVPLDGSVGAQAALEPGAELLLAMAAPGQKCAMHLARVCKRPAGEQEVSEHRLRNHNEMEQARGFLLQITQRMHEGTLAPAIEEQHIPVTWSLLLNTDVAAALLRLAEQGEDTEGAGVFGGCDLIAISTHGRAGFHRWVLGSITERLLHATSRPILIVHPPSEAARQEPLYVEGKQPLNTNTFLHF